MDIEILSKFNPWWVEKNVPAELTGTHKRPILDEIYKYLDKRYIILLYGLRRVGKTTILYQIIDELLKKGEEPANILYFSFDDKTASIGEIISAYEEKVRKKRIGESERAYLFFDEIQKVGDWQSDIKILYDLHPRLKIFLSGSASIALQRKSKESLAGRIIDLFVTPLTFSEFLQWKGVNIDMKKPEMFQLEIKPHFMDYLRKGGFPEIINENSDEIIRKYIKNAVIEHIIYQDLPREFGLKDIGLLKILLEAIANEPGMIVNIDRLVRDLKRNRITIGNYLEYLRYGLLVSIISNLREGMLVSSRKNKKVYPANCSFCFAYRDDFFADNVLEKVAETVVSSHINAEYYYRNSFEIDFVKKSKGEPIPIEVKYGSAETRQLKLFRAKFNAPKGLLISRDTFAQEDGIKVVPLWFFLLQPTEKTIDWNG